MSKKFEQHEDVPRWPEKELLLSLSTDFVAVRDTGDLLKVVTSQLKELIGFSHIHICTINEDGNTFTSYIADPLSKSNDHPLYPKAKKMKLPIDNGFIDKSYHSAEPISFNLDELKDDPALPFYFKMVYDNGIRQVVIMRLSKADRVYGFWFLFFEHVHTMDENKLKLVKGLSHQISSAVLNIMSNEDIKKREEEKARILAFSNAIISETDKGKLSKIIKFQLAELFNIRDFCFWLITRDKKKRRAFLFDADSVFAKHPSFQKMQDQYFDNADHVYDLIVDNSRQLTVFDVDEWKDWPDPHPYMDIIEAMGMKQMGGNMVGIGEEDIGIMTFSHDNINELSNHYRLYESICSQLAVVASNLYNIEKITRREEETSRILAFSNAIASVKDKELLGKIIHKQLTDLFHITDYCVWIISKDRRQRMPFLFDRDARFARHPSFQHVLGIYTDNNGRIYEAIMGSETVVLLEEDDWNKWTDPQPYSDLVKDLGLKGRGGSMIKLAEEEIAIMTFAHDNITEMNNQLGLYQSICSQLSIVVSNLVNNERIIRKEEETSRILAFSNAIASVMDKELLAKIIREQLTDLFKINDYCLWTISKDRTKRMPFLFDKDSTISRHPDFQHFINTFTPVDDYLFRKSLESDEVTLLNADDWNQPASPAHIYAEYAKEIGFTGLGGNRIRVAEEDIAVITFCHKTIFDMKENLGLYKAICSQLAIAVSNLLATQKVNDQLVEINKYKQRLEEEKVYLQEEIDTVHNSSDIIGNGSAIKTVFGLINKVSSSDSTVLILGETGTGKELVARAIHNNSARKGKLMVKVNCAALPVHLIESELFGHERGSFTGAYERRIGKFELANNGTLFLDEIGEMPLELQVKLLRVLQEKEIERIGGKNLIKVDARIIAATNRDLEKEMHEGRFRSDLFYRLNIFPIQIPPLRERSEDIHPLTNYFIEKFSKKTGKTIRSVSNIVMKELNNYSWPGNVRELEHIIERSVLLANGETIANVSLRSSGKTAVEHVATEFKLRTIEDHERELILNTLNYCNGQISGSSGAAHILGIPPTTLHSKMKKLGIMKTHSKNNSAM